MPLATSLTEEKLGKTQLYDNGIIIHYWRVFREECLGHFEVLLTIWVGDHRIVAQLQLRVDTTFALAIDGRTITLEAFHNGIGIALGENGDHLGPIRLIDNDADGMA
jgi:hypothetical protein